MNRLLVFLVATAFGLVLALALIAGHPSPAYAGPAPDEPAVAPVGGDRTTGVDYWILNPAPPTPTPVVVPAAVAPAATTTTATTATPASAAIDPTPAPTPPPRANLIGPATTAPAVTPVTAATPLADSPAPPSNDPPPVVDPADPAATEAPAPEADVTVAVAYALGQVGLPYRYAASGPNAFDCSGLTMAAYREIGIELPHRSESQVNLGRGIDWQSDGILPGDLVVTAGGNGRHYAGHVGLAVSATEWVVAPATGQRVTRETMPFDRIEAVRRLVEPAG